MVNQSENVISLYDFVVNFEEELADACKDGFDRYLEQGRGEGLPLFIMIRAALAGLQKSVSEHNAHNLAAKFNNPFKNELLNFLQDHYELTLVDEVEKKYKEAFE